MLDVVERIVDVENQLRSLAQLEAYTLCQVVSYGFGVSGDVLEQLLRL